MQVSLPPEESPLIMKLMKLGKVLRTALLLQVLVLALGDLNADTGEVDPELDCQEALVEALALHFESLAPVDGAEVRFAELRMDLKQLEDATLARKKSREQLAQLEREIRILSQGVSAYRAQYLQWVRLIAEGEKHPEIRLRKGKIYREVVIRRVTDIGMEIRHLSGSARLRHDDLGEEWQDRFLWTGEEALRSLVAEANADRKAAALQRYAVEQGRDPVIAREEAKARLYLAELESSTPIVPAKLEPSEPLELAELESAELEPARKVGSPSPGKSR
ncbi:MAG: hypothetical protein CMN02_11755 [Roseibacillus sp.]|nr:hypothetical protein [Roseibacillus sp.]|tara:strand:+ start:2329 stop:3159 length:831 start_codon:yes stop_codon:yes gene_type:complete